MNKIYTSPAIVYYYLCECIMPNAARRSYHTDFIAAAQAGFLPQAL